MDDQANRLRELVNQGNTPAPTDRKPRPKLVVVTGGQRGVGTTTLAVNLALALVRRRRRSLLVDANPHGGRAARLCRIDAAHKPDRGPKSREPLEDLLRPGPGGLQVLPVSGTRGSLSRPSAAGRPWLVGPLQGLGSQAERVVVDAGNGMDPPTGGVGQAADALLVITTPDVVAVMAAYASIKALAAAGPPPPVYTVVNMAPSRSAARRVHVQLAEACRRFLNAHVEGIGYVAEDPAIASASKAGAPLLLTSPRCRPARQIRRMAKRLARTLKRSAVTV
jgi:flagellar biosynthesis protein FlhG